MELTEAFIYLFSDSFLAMLVVPFKNFFVFNVMNLFGGYSKLIMVICVAFGALTGAAVNYSIGIAIKKFSKMNPRSEKWLQFEAFCHKYDYIIASLCFIPIFAPIFTTALGFVKIRFKVFAIAVLLVNLIFFSILSFI